MTDDFRKVMEEASGENLSVFFQQWIFTKGYPEIKWSWNYQKGKVILNIDQVQEHHLFEFPLEIAIETEGSSVISMIRVNKKKSTYEIEVDAQPDSIVLDPNLWLLFVEK